MSACDRSQNQNAQEEDVDVGPGVDVGNGVSVINHFDTPRRHSENLRGTEEDNNFGTPPLPSNMNHPGNARANRVTPSGGDMHLGTLAADQVDLQHFSKEHLKNYHVDDGYPKTASEVFKNNIQLDLNLGRDNGKKHKTNVDNILRKNMRRYIFRKIKFLPVDIKKFLTFNDDENSMHVAVKELMKHMAWTNFSLVDQAILWNTYGKISDRVMAQCRSTVCSHMKRKVVCGKI